VPGREEYLNSEKYEYKVWDWDRPGNIIPFITRLNEIRREHLALQEYENLRFHPADDDNILCYGKSTDSGDDNVLVIVNLDPFEAHTSTVTIPQELLAGSDRRVQVENLLTGERYVWTGFTQTVSLDPAVNPVAILSLTR
jgi:starch synthase (maltosyl-transferring)